MREIFEIRRLLEFSALQVCDDATVSELVGLAREMDALRMSDNLPTLIDVDFRFHQRLVDALDNSRLATLFSQCLSELRIVLCLIDESEPSDLVQHHIDACRLLAKGERLAAARVLDRNFEETEALIFDMLS